MGMVLPQVSSLAWPGRELWVRLWLHPECPHLRWGCRAVGERKAAPQDLVREVLSRAGYKTLCHGRSGAFQTHPLKPSAGQNKASWDGQFWAPFGGSARCGIPLGNGPSDGGMHLSCVVGGPWPDPRGAFAGPSTRTLHPTLHSSQGAPIQTRSSVLLISLQAQKLLTSWLPGATRRWGSG